MDRCDVVIIGAGPYGLSAAAHLRSLRSLDVRVFGEPMSFWKQHMPEGMFLRSPWVGSHIADPNHQFTLDAYRRCGNHFSAEIPRTVRDEIAAKEISQQIPLRDFINYGLWFQQNAALPADRRKVLKVEPDSGRFRLTLQDGRELCARRVVVAAGIQPFAHRPSVFAGLPASLVTHASEKQDFAKLRNKKVLVIGGGQSALESAVLLNEDGASVETLIRDSTVRWLRQWWPWLHSKAISWMLYGAADVGPAGISLFVQRPHLFRLLPRGVQHKWGPRSIRPAASNWVKARTADLTIRTSKFVSQARTEGERLRVWLNDGSERVVDHILLGTGYQVNIALYPFLSAQLLDRVAQVDGYPRLDRGFETSVRGLHFLGAPAAWSFGPLMRFVAGTEFAAPALTRRIGKTAQLTPVAVRDGAETLVSAQAVPR